MTFLWPHVLWLLFAIPVLVAAYMLLLWRRRALALRFPSLDLVRRSADSGGWIRFHVPPFLFLAAIIAMLIAIARPAITVSPPFQQRTIILVMDVSPSMGATDVGPTRLAVAQSVAKAIVGWQPPDVRVGIIAISGHADLVLPPSLDREYALAVIDGLAWYGHGSGIGIGVLAALITLFPRANIGGGYDIFGFRAPEGYHALRDRPKAAKPMLRTLDPPESGADAVIVLLTDGESNFGISPAAAAKQAADRGTRVYTVGIGTARGTINATHGVLPVGFDARLLREVAAAGRGGYFYAGTSTNLKKAYRKLRGQVVFEASEREISAVFAAAATVLMLASAMLSLLWFTHPGR